MTVLLARVLAALHLEDDDLVTLHKWCVNFYNYFCSLYDRCANFYGVAVCDEQDFVKLYGLTGFSVTDVVYKKLFALLNLELLTINNYDCVHFCIYVFNVSPRGEFLMKLLSMSPGDKIGCKVRTFFWNDQNSLSSFFNKFQSAGVHNFLRAVRCRLEILEYSLMRCLGCRQGWAVVCHAVMFSVPWAGM